jgi:hypothetical protein
VLHYNSKRAITSGRENSVVCVYGLGFTLPVRVNAIMKFINTLSISIRSIYVGVCVKLCKCI